jgi:hypothetical protein
VPKVAAAGCTDAAGAMGLVVVASTGGETETVGVDSEGAIENGRRRWRRKQDQVAAANLG